MLSNREPKRQPDPVLRQVTWASMPVWSLGFLSSLPFLAYAVTSRRTRDWVVFGAYLAATIAIDIALGAVNPDSNAGGAVLGLVIALAGGATVHTAILYRPERTGEARSGPYSPEQLNRQALAEAKSMIERRKVARQLVSKDPALARDLRIGRPDLGRKYDDGGLVDVNHVPGRVLATALGMTLTEVKDVTGAREQLGRFSSADELCAYTQLSPDRVDELRDLMIFT
jgi:hypothetical protein